MMSVRVIMFCYIHCIMSVGIIGSGCDVNTVDRYAMLISLLERNQCAIMK